MIIAKSRESKGRGLAGRKAGSSGQVLTLTALLVTLIAGVFICSGCALFRWGRRSESGSTEANLNVPEQLQVAVDLHFDDIPVPAGFKLDKVNSFAFQNDYTRVGLLKYTGRAKVFKVVDFYKEQMPLYNWVLVNVVEYDRSLLNFEKDGQSCIITVEGTMTRTALTIAVAPKSQKSAKK